MTSLRNERYMERSKDLKTRGYELYRIDFRVTQRPFLFVWSQSPELAGKYARMAADKLEEGETSDFLDHGTIMREMDGSAMVASEEEIRSFQLNQRFVPKWGHKDSDEAYELDED